MATNTHPYRPGTSPFRAKGVVYLNAFEYFERFVPGGKQAVMARIADPQMDAFFHQPFLAGSWYDVFPSLPMQQAAAQLMRQPYTEFIRTMAQVQAERDMNGIYRMFLKLASPDMVMARIPKLASQYFDFVQADIQQVSVRNYHSTLTGLPASVVSVYMAVSEAFLSVTLRAAGANALRIRCEAPEPDGVRAGIEIVKMRREIRWDV